MNRIVNADHLVVGKQYKLINTPENLADVHPHTTQNHLDLLTTHYLTLANVQSFMGVFLVFKNPNGTDDKIVTAVKTNTKFQEKIPFASAEINAPRAPISNGTQRKNRKSRHRKNRKSITRRRR